MALIRYKLYNGSNRYKLKSPSFVGKGSFVKCVKGDVTLTNVSGVWSTTNAQLAFSCSWSSIYPISGNSSNFKTYVSQNANFSPQEEVSTSWARQLDGLSGTVNSTPSVLIPTTPGSPYYLKLVFTDTEGFESTKTFTYYTPLVQNHGTMSFNAIASNNNNKNVIWFHSNIIASSFEYYPSKKRIIATNDNWQHTLYYIAWKNYPNDVEMFITFDPDTYTTEMEVQDIYGNVFRTTQEKEVVCPQPVLWATPSNDRGYIYMWVKINPKLDYTTGNNRAVVEITSQDDPQYLMTIDLGTNPQPIYRNDITVDDGTYDVNVYVVSGNYNFTLSKEVTIECTGYIEVTDLSVFNNDIMTFQATYQMGKYAANVNTFTVTLWDEDSGVEIINFTPTVTGNGFSGTLTYPNNIQLPSNWYYIAYRVSVTNTAGYTNSEYIEFEI